MEAPKVFYITYIIIKEVKLRRNARAGMEQTTGFSIPLFSDDEFEEIHGATLEILENTGVYVQMEEALDIFEKGGAMVNRETKIVKLPQYLVEDAIRTAPSKLFLAGRDPKNDVILEGSRVGFTTFGEGIQVKDIETGELKAPTKEDVKNAAKLADALSEIDVYERAVGAHDVPQEVGQIHNAEATFNNTSKHVFMGPFDGYQLERIVEMAAEISGGRDKLLERPLV
ncbi:MAG: Trimethylamine methyltransferase MttB, partial [Deltaproteobacteria bacterium]